MTTVQPPSDALLRRVRALLAKAESTDFPAEAENLIAKAQELMTRHAIDEAILRSGRSAAEPIDSQAVIVESPYAGPKSALLGTVASTNRCRMVIHTVVQGTRRCVLVGHRSDISATKLMFTALSLHATREMLSAEVPPWDSPRRFRHAFLLAFALRIGERLRAADEAARSDVEHQVGASVALVLADRSHAVDRAYEARFPKTRPVRVQASSGAGLRSGRDAANRASLGQRPIGDDRRALEAG